MTYNDPAQENGAATWLLHGTAPHIPKMLLLGLTLVLIRSPKNMADMLKSSPVKQGSSMPSCVCVHAHVYVHVFTYAHVCGVHMVEIREQWQLLLLKCPF